MRLVPGADLRAPGNDPLVGSPMSRPHAADAA